MTEEVQDVGCGLTKGIFGAELGINTSVREVLNGVSNSNSSFGGDKIFEASVMMKSRADVPSIGAARGPCWCTAFS